MPTEPIRPLRDVWLRPRRVFRELAGRPVGMLDYLLAAAQGVVNFLALFRTQDAGAHASAMEILGESLLFGPIGGILGMLLFGAIYARLGTRAGGKSSRAQVIHVLAYGGVPVAASLALWLFAVLLAGEAAFVKTPNADVEAFLVLLLKVQFVASVILMAWSVVLQVMGFSEIQGLATRKAFWVWILGQFIGLLAALVLSVMIAGLFPNLVPR